jgi:hypothetical protein
MAFRTPQQLAARRRIEQGIALAAPFLDVVLAVGDRVSRVTGRGQIDPEPPRRPLDAPSRTPLGGGPDRA